MRDIFIIFVAILNFLLFSGKIIVGIISNSVALISDAINSFTDTINSLIVLWATKVARKKADKNHPAGHGRAQPLAAFFVAIMTSVLAIEIIKESIIKIINPTIITHLKEAIIVLVITIITKGLLSVFEHYKGKRDRNSALIAMSIESRGDMLISFGVIVGILFSVKFGFNWVDPLVGILVGIYVFYTGYKIAKENTDFLMGASAKKDDIEKIKQVIDSFSEVISFHNLKAQYLGEKLQVTVHCEVKKDISAIELHNLETKISRKIESLELVEKALVHIDPKIEK